MDTSAGTPPQQMPAAPASNCSHQWSVWTGLGDTQKRWCHVCNESQERPTARHYQEFDHRTRPHELKNLGPCRNPGCRARAGNPCRDSNRDEVLTWRHGDRTVSGDQMQRGSRRP